VNKVYTSSDSAGKEIREDFLNDGTILVSALFSGLLLSKGF
jgi:hypothetical protein